jgi:hypothetical protein
LSPGDGIFLGKLCKKYNRKMRNSIWLILGFLGLLAACKTGNVERIDRLALVNRNNPHVQEIEELSSLSVGNGNFAFTVDATGMQTFPEAYANGVPLGTQAQWGWHSFPNPIDTLLRRR